MKTICVRFLNVSAQEDIRDLLMSDLINAEFNSFWEDLDVINAYIDESLFDVKIIETILSKDSFSGVRFEVENMEDKNWNEEWEKNFDPVVVAEKIYVHAPFHAEAPDYPYQIIIEPKMSFGTAHHATTALMLEHMLEIPFQNKTVADVGCGTGILGIFALQQGATQMLAFDNDEWAFSNAKENFAMNHLDPSCVFQGDASLLENRVFDILLINIHKNIIIADTERYSNALKVSGTLLFSGFHPDDLADINDQAERFGLKLEKFLLRDDWVAARFIKLK